MRQSQFASLHEPACCARQDFLVPGAFWEPQCIRTCLQAWHRVAKVLYWQILSSIVSAYCLLEFWLTSAVRSSVQDRTQIPWTFRYHMYLFVIKDQQLSVHKFKDTWEIYKLRPVLWNLWKFISKGLDPCFLIYVLKIGLVFIQNEPHKQPFLAKIRDIILIFFFVSNARNHSGKIGKAVHC